MVAEISFYILIDLYILNINIDMILTSVLIPGEKLT